MFGTLNKISFCWWNFTYVCLFLLSFKGQVNSFSDVVMKPLGFNTVSVLFSNRNALNVTTPVENILFTLLCTLHQPSSIDQCLFLAVVNFILAATQVRYF